MRQALNFYGVDNFKNLFPLIVCIIYVTSYPGQQNKICLRSLVIVDRGKVKVENM